MKVGLRIVVIILVVAVGSANAIEPEGTSKRVFLDQKGGGIELLATDSKDTEARDAAREEMRRAADDPTFLGSPEIEPHLDKITSRYEQTNRGGRLRISAKTPDALRAVQDFLRTHMVNGDPNAVAIRFIKNTSLVSVPVMINNSGPFQFLIDTGASSSVLSETVAGRLNAERLGTGMLHTGGGTISASLRRLSKLQVGEAVMRDVEIFAANFATLERLEVDGILGADYLRRFKVKIDYEKQVMQIEPLTPLAMALA